MNYSHLYKGTAIVYTLSDKRGNVFYVGCTVNKFYTRFSCHISEARGAAKSKNITPKNKKIIELDFDIVGSIVEQKYVTGMNKWSLRYDARKMERIWIEKYIALGYNLCNKEATPVEDKPDYVGLSLAVENGKIKKITHA